MTIKVDAIYARQSIEKRDSLSIESQIDLCRRMADPDAVIYQDAGYSGKNTQRPAFARMMDDIKAGKIKRVFCYRLDRISRSVYDFSLLWDTFDSHNVEFVSVTESFDTNTPMGRAMVIIIMAFAQLERETIVSRYTTNRYARSNSGVWAGGKAPYGFEIIKQLINGKNQSVLAPVPDKANTVKWMFHEYANGTASLYSIAKRLNVQGIRAESRAGYWNSTTVRRVLRNPVYVRADVDIYSYYYDTATITNDVYEFSGEHACYLTVKGGKSSSGEKTLSIAHHDGIIPSDLFIDVQKLLSANKQIKNGVRSPYTWLSGLVKCAGCGGRVSCYPAKGLTYFQCYRRFRSYGSCRTKISGNAKKYESFVATAIQNKLNNISDEKPTGTELNAEMNVLKIKLVENEQQTANLVEAIKIGGGAAMRAIKAELEKLEAEHELIVSEISAIKPSHRLPEGLLLVDFDNLDYDGKRDVARTVIDCVLVGDDHPIEIKWKI